MAKKKTTKATEETPQAEPTIETTQEQTSPVPDILAHVRKGDELRIEDREGSTPTFACNMTVTKVGKDRVYCGSTSFRKDNGQEIGGNDHMFACPVGQNAEATQDGTATPKATKARKSAKPKDPQDKKPSALEAAAKVLSEADEPMNCQDLIKAMAEKGYWTSPGGKTPHSTLYAAVTKEIKLKGPDSRFVKADKGKFARQATA